jgi:hypothetical protein
MFALNVRRQSLSIGKVLLDLQQLLLGCGLAVAAYGWLSG